MYLLQTKLSCGNRPTTACDRLYTYRQKRDTKYLHNSNIYAIEYPNNSSNEASPSVHTDIHSRDLIADKNQSQFCEADRRLDSYTASPMQCSVLTCKS